jgi:2-octaprenyl-3-methyl-6-methoxy-1,4-benzoquinol hydroxylase/2-octaprenylphenol hydroxylase
MKTDFDAVIVGGGVAGAAAAALLADAGHRVALIDAGQPRSPASGDEIDPRVVAIAPGSAAVLGAAGAWDELPAERIGRYDRMQVHAGTGSLEFRASEHGLEQLGWIVEVGLLRSTLWTALARRDATEIMAPATVSDFAARDDHLRIVLDDERRLRTRLVIAADGARSRLRRLAGIEQDVWHYNQAALVAHVQTEEANDGLAWQRFTEHGPLAMLPLADGRSSIVWSQPAERARRLADLDDDAFLEALDAHQDSPFGAATAATPRHTVALVRRRARALVRGRLALLGDAARTVHPLAGQGLNLGLMDAAALAECLSDTGAPRRPERALGHYERWRMSDGGLVAGGIHAINEMTCRMAPGRMLAGAGFGIAARLWPLRQAFVERACGIDRGSPRLARSAR